MLTFLAIVFFFSGTASLAYEITWVRLFSVLFGNSTYAISLVVALFMGGLALGGYLFGKWIDHRDRPLLAYGLVEIAIGLSALPVPYFAQWAEAPISRLYQSDVPSLMHATATRALLAFCILFFPTTLMGATLPIITKCFVRSLGAVGTGVGVLYGVNSLGAVVGCYGASLYLIRLLGITSTSYVACGINLAVGIAVLHAHYFVADADALTHRAPAGTYASDTRARNAFATKSRWRVFVLIALFVSGFTALSYEVIWARILGFILHRGMSIYAFAVMLSLYLMGLAVGSLIYARWLSRRTDSIRLFGWVQLLVGTLVIASLAAVSTFHASRWLQFGDYLLLGHLAKAGSLMFVPTVILGIAFPIGCRIVTQSSSELGSSVGRAYAVNTLGAVLGPLATGFLLIPSLGSEVTLKAMVSANLLMGAALLTFRREGTVNSRGLQSAMLLIVSCGVTCLLASNAHLVLDLFNTRKAKVAYFKEGPSTAVLATQTTGGIALSVGGTVGAGTLPTFRQTTELLAYIPLLLKEDPSHVLVVGFGTGRTARFYAEYPSVAHVDVVEISEAVYQIGSEFFSSYNRDVLKKPHVSALIDDAFNFVKYTRNRYDVIVLDPFTPHLPASARLYTKEFLEHCRAKLREDGIVVLWALAAWSRWDSFATALKTFQSVFPHTTVWLTPNERFLIFLGAAGRLRGSREDLDARLRLRPALGGGDRYAIDDLRGYLNTFFLDEKAVRELLAPARVQLHTVDRPHLEFLIHTDRSPRIPMRRLRAKRGSILSELAEEQ